MLPVLLKGAPRNARAARVHELMGRWNRFMLANRAEPLIYTAWIWQLQRGLLADELGEDLFETMVTPDVPLMMRIIRDKPGWCDDGGTRQTETCEDQIAARARPRAGLDRAPPGTGYREMAVGPRALRRASPSAVRRRAAAARSRLGALSLRRRRPDAQPRPALLPRRRPFEAVHGAGYRGVYDFSDLDNSRFAMPLGQSGNMLSPWARNFVDRWQTLGYVEIAGTHAEVARTAVGTITLSPPPRGDPGPLTRLPRGPIFNRCSTPLACPARECASPFDRTGRKDDARAITA